MAPVRKRIGSSRESAPPVGWTSGIREGRATISVCSRPPAARESQRGIESRRERAENDTSGESDEHGSEVQYGGENRIHTSWRSDGGFQDGGRFVDFE
jgi:hypothetical protein